MKMMMMMISGVDCLTNLIDFFHYIFDVYYESKSVDDIHLDFQKAFDKVSQKRLLHKLLTLGTSCNIYNCLHDWLSERKRSGFKWADLKWKVAYPMDSVLGLILFLIYVDDIDEVISCKISKFADDTKLTVNLLHHLTKKNLAADLDRYNYRANTW